MTRTASAVRQPQAPIWEKSYPAGIKWDMSGFESKPLFALLDNAVKKYPKCPAIEFLGHVYDYETLGSLVDRAALGLQRLGVGKDVKVGLFMPNTAYLPLMYYAILKAGGTVVNYNPMYVDKDLLGQIEDSETDLMVTVDVEAISSRVTAMLEKSRLKGMIICPMRENLTQTQRGVGWTENARHIWFCDLIDNAGKPAGVMINPAEDVAVLQYTGGTTGIPKGAMLTHANLYANAVQVGEWIHVVEPGKDCQICVLPMFHVFSMTVVMNYSLVKGMKLIIVPQFDLKEVLELVQTKKPSIMSAVPTIFNAMANYAHIGNYDLSSLKFCLSGGAPLPVDVMNNFAEKTKVPRVTEGYGLTESSPVATANPASGVMKPGSIGPAIPGTMIEIVCLKDGVTILPPGEKGEVCIRGPQVMKGYYKKPEETAKVIKDGRLHTGDVGYMDEDGFVFLVDRIKDLILVRGFNVYPRHIEEAFYQHPAVQECLVAGVPDAARGEAVWAWIFPRAGMAVNEADLRAFLDGKIASMEMPRKIIIREQPLPKTAVGKLSRKDLLEQEGIRK